MKLNQFGRPRRVDIILAAARAADTDDCVFTDLRPNLNGYVTAWYRSTKMGAHRIVCLNVHGEPDGELDAAHSCGRPACVNPRHIRWATHLDNVADQVAHGTRHWGERRPAAKVTNAQAVELRRRYQAGEITTRDIAKLTGLNGTNSRMLAAGRSYREPTA